MQAGLHHGQPAGHAPPPHPVTHIMRRSHVHPLGKSGAGLAFRVLFTPPNSLYGRRSEEEGPVFSATPKATLKLFIINTLHGMWDRLDSFCHRPWFHLRGEDSSFRLHHHGWEANH